MKAKKVYACYNKNKDVRLNSSSGGVFSAISEYVFNKNGIVYGVAMSEDCYSSEFIAVTDKIGLEKLRGSKYFQAKIGNIFRQVKNDLITGKTVLFTGTGCQVNGLKSFLGKDYDNLICADVICHGVPSPYLWEKYARNQEEINDGKLKQIEFRCKDDSWINYGMKEILKKNTQDKEIEKYISKDMNTYMQMFLRNFCLRPSCYECVAKKKLESDLTLGDFWGVKELPELFDGIGTSLVFIRTNKGQDIFNHISDKMIFKEISYELAVKSNPAEYRSCMRPLQRDEFFVDMHKLSFKEMEKKYDSQIKYSLGKKVKIKVVKIFDNCR